MTDLQHWVIWSATHETTETIYRQAPDFSGQKVEKQQVS